MRSRINSNKSGYSSSNTCYTGSDYDAHRIANERKKKDEADRKALIAKLEKKKQDDLKKAKEDQKKLQDALKKEKEAREKKDQEEKKKAQAEKEKKEQEEKKKAQAGMGR